MGLAAGGEENYGLAGGCKGGKGKIYEKKLGMGRALSAVPVCAQRPTTPMEIINCGSPSGGKKYHNEMDKGQL